MPFVIKNSKAQYGAGSGRWGGRWVSDLDDARVFARKGDAIASLRATFADRGHNKEATLKVVPVKVVEDDGQAG